MENKTIARTLRLLSQLMELHNENPFKVKTIASAAFTVDKLPYSLSKKSLPEIEKINGIGKSTASKVWELIETGSLEEVTTLLAQTPPGIVEIMSIKGLGPKKVLVIWKELGIESAGELLYACNENRLIEAKGFGLKTQEEIRKAIEFKMANEGHFLYAHIEPMANDLLDTLRQSLPGTPVSFSGAFRRRCEVLSKVEFLIGKDLSDDIGLYIESLEDISEITREEDRISFTTNAGVKVELQFCPEERFALELFERTGSEKHVNMVKELLAGDTFLAADEIQLYARAGLPFIEPELREGLNEIKLAEADKLPELLEYTDLKGTLHNHSTWSDGVNTLEEMALYCRDELHLEYLGICDHSKSAFYAKGLSEERVLAQHREIDQINRKFAPFKIFKGIESDILFDGSLDYPAEILSTFDFIVASIHSVFKMTEEKATARLIAAIENPYTTILGHPTGRMLLARKGYPVDFKKVIDACAANGVVIEINSNPLRLDLDWRWHQYALEKGVMLSVNPDAHSNKSFRDMHFGVLTARKGGVSANRCLNTFSKDEIEAFFKQKKSARS